MKRALNLVNFAGKLYKNVKDKPILFNEWSKNYEPDIEKLDIKLMNFNKLKTLKDHITNIKICLAFGDFVYALSNNNNILNFIENNPMITNYKIVSEVNVPNVLFLNWNKNLLVIYKGSTTFSDMISDINIKMIPIYSENKSAEIHKGIYNKFCRLNIEVENTICDILKKNEISNIIFTGHSLGAGLSTLSAVNAKKKYSKLNIYNYCSASMKIGNLAFKDYYKSLEITTVNLINESDIAHNFPKNENFYHIDSLDKNSNPVFDSKTGIYNAHLTTTYIDNVEKCDFKNI